MEPYPAAFRGQMGAEGYLKSSYLSVLGGEVIDRRGILSDQYILIDVDISPMDRRGSRRRETIL